MNHLVPALTVVLFLGLIATWVPGGSTTNVLVGDTGGKFVLNHNEYLNVSNGQYYLVMQPDCDLVLYDTLGNPVSYSNSSRPTVLRNCSLWMQSTDGNLVVYNLTSTVNLTGHAIWSQGYSTVSLGGDAFRSFLLLRGDGNLDFYNANSTRRTQFGGSINAWNAFNNVPAGANVSALSIPIDPSQFKAWKPSVSLDELPYMPTEYFLSVGKRLLTLSKNYELKLGTDCNLTSSRLGNNGTTAEEVLWSPVGYRYSGNASCQLTLQPNGVLQIHSTVDPSQVYWNSTNATSTGNSYVSWILEVDPINGNLSVSDITNPDYILWTNNVGVKVPTPVPAPVPPVKSNQSTVWIVVGAVGGALVLAMAASGLYIYSRQYFLDPADKAFQVRLRASGGNSQAFSEAKIKRATNNYNNMLGRGGFGDVFYGKLPDGTEVAAKVLSGNSHQSKQEFYNEIELLSKVHHKYLVSLLAYSCTRTHQVLVYEFMGGGNLRQRLQGEIDADYPLTWQQRTSIILQVAEGLEYLHHKCSPPIIHRDIKSTNILLSHKSVAKVADFGLSKLKTIGQEDATHVTTAVKGTPGYLDPEYHETGLLTEKSDVYAFGVVLLEILTGRHHMYIAQGVRDAWRLEQFDGMADSNVGEDYDREELVNLVELALWCARNSSPERPSMEEVVRRLHDILLPPLELTMIESAEEDGHRRFGNIELMLLNADKSSSEVVPFSKSSMSGMSSEVRV